MPKKTKEQTKVKATRASVTQLVITAAWDKVYSTGKKGFFGQALDPSTGKKYQIIGAVELTPKAA